jgi:hypothetical protein
MRHGREQFVGEPMVQNELLDDRQLSAPPRAQLPDVARLTGIPERTLQHWFREYSSYRSRRGYPQQLIVDVLRDHDWEGDVGGVLHGLESGSAAQEQAMERHAATPPELLRDHEQRLATIAEQCGRIAEDLATVREQHAELGETLIREIQQLRALSTQVATLNELRGVREDLLAMRAGQQRAEQAQCSSQEQIRQLQAALQRRRWWQIWR